MIVLDASIVMSWYFLDEHKPERLAIISRVAEAGAIVPPHWQIEIANSFVTAVRKKRTDPERRDAALAALRELPIRVDPDAPAMAWSNVVSLAQRYDLTAYDAAYLELAERRKLPLATLDRDLAAAARAAGVQVLP